MDWEDYEDDFEQEETARPRKKGGRRKNPDEATPAAVPGEAVEERRSGRVASITRLHVTIVTSGGIVATPPARDAEGGVIKLATGDDVIAARRGENWRIEEVLPRRTRLSRPNPHDSDQERTFAANVDVAILVMSLRQPPLRAGLADRFIVSAQRGGVEPALVINKIDLAPEEDPAELEPYCRMEIPIVFTSVKTRAGLADLASLIRGRTSVLVGHSGVGKSSMLRALLEEFGGEADLTIRTGEVNTKAGVGRHTTTAATLYDLGGGTWIIDTPGVRQFGLWDLDIATLVSSFPDIQQASAECRFTDCTHSHEPDCAVQAAVDEGAIDEARYETYLRLLAEV